MSLFVFQIYFDEESRKAIDPGFIPFDNQFPIDRELYEFSVMYEWFKNHSLNDGDYYGFVSPSFYNKTGLNSADVHRFVAEHYLVADAFFFSSGWDQIAYHKNVFYQGEYFHPGFLNVATEFFQALGGDPSNVLESYSVFSNSVFSNYVIANARYWRAWLELADKFYEIYKAGIVSSLHLPATYAKSDTTQAVFLQERLHSYLLLQHEDLNVISYDTTQEGPMLLTMFVDTPLNRKIIRSCEALKCLYLESGDTEALVAYNQVKSKIKFS